jgi:hypothetical protein
MPATAGEASGVRAGVAGAFRLPRHLAIRTLRRRPGAPAWPSNDLEGVVSKQGQDGCLGPQCLLRVRRDVGKKQEVKVHYDEGLAIHIDPKSCAVTREGLGDARAGAPGVGGLRACSVRREPNGRTARRAPIAIGENWEPEPRRARYHR